MKMIDGLQVATKPTEVGSEQVAVRLNAGVENIRSAVAIIAGRAVPGEAVTIYVGEPVTGRVTSLEDGTVIYAPSPAPTYPDLPDAIVPEPLGGACDCCHGSGRKPH